MSETISSPAYSLTDLGDITEVVISALMTVYDSQADLEAVDILESIERETGFSAEQTLPVVDYMFNKEVNPLLMHSHLEGQRVALGAAGLWMIEDCFTHGEDSLDSMQIAAQQVARAGFMKLS